MSAPLTEDISVFVANIEDLKWMLFLLAEIRTLHEHLSFSEFIKCV